MNDKFKPPAGLAILATPTHERILARDAAMKIQVEYTAQLKRAAGAGAESVELAAPASLDDLMAALAGRHGEEFQRLLIDGQGRRQTSVLVFVGDRQVPRNEKLELTDGQVVTLVSPISGG